MAEYGDKATCKFCPDTIVAEVPTFADSPDPLWRSERTQRAGCDHNRKPEGGLNWHEPEEASEA